MARRHDIDRILQEWPYEPGEISARLVRAADGREVLQMRVEMGLCSWRPKAAPTASTPSGKATTYFEYLLKVAAKAGDDFELTPEQCHRGRPRVHAVLSPPGVLAGAAGISPSGRPTPTTRWAS